MVEAFNVGEEVAVRLNLRGSDAMVHPLDLEWVKLSNAAGGWGSAPILLIG